MLKILVAEDEKLIRKGIIGLIDWNQYDSKIIGEVGTSKAVLEFLMCHEVDILLTDLTMPGVCGIEYLEQLKANFPNLYIIVLTMHREFDMIQKALRLDIADYMTKDQIENEDFEENLVRILYKIKVEKIEKKKMKEVFCSWNRGIVLISLKEEELEDLLGEDKFFIETGLYLDQKSYLIPFSEEAISYIKNSKKEIYGVLVKDLQRKAYKRIRKEMEYFRQTKLFYLYEPHIRIYELGEEKEERTDDIEWEKIFKQFYRSEWITDSKFYHQSLIELANLQLSQEELTVFAYQLYIEWAKYTGSDTIRYFDSISKIHWWYEWKEWFKKNREILQSQFCDGSNEMLSNSMIQKVLQYVEQHYREEISLEHILKEVGMSKSHFSKVFKNATGDTFVQYLNQYRIEKAKVLLKETNYTHCMVAEYVGFTSERYFRKVFIEKVGMKPTEYRRRYKSKIGHIKL